MHNVILNSYAYIYTLRRRSQVSGAKIITSFSVNESIHNDEFSVEGILGTDSNGNQLKIRCRYGVVIVTGSFSSNDELKRILLPRAEKIRGLNPTATGDGILLSMKIGAGVSNVDIKTAQLRFKRHSVKTSLKFLSTWPFPKLALIGINIFPMIVTRAIIKLASSHTAPSDAVFKEGAVLVNRDGIIV